MDHKFKRFEAVTVQLRFQDMSSAFKWYTLLFGKDADHVADAKFREWEIFDNFWIQIVEGEPITDGPRIRLGVKDLHHSMEELKNHLGIIIQHEEIIPNSVKFCNFEDPWGNKLGLFQDLIRYPL